MKRLFLVFLLLSVFSIHKGYSQFNENKKTVTRILFVLDASGSMAARFQTTPRINLAKEILLKLADSLVSLPNVEIALRVYGHQSDKYKKDCEDSKLEVPFFIGNYNLIASNLSRVYPRGSTPIAYSLLQSAGDFPPDPFARNIVILITDGLEACDGDPCEISLALQKRKIFLKPYIVGLGLDAGVRLKFDCVGNYLEASSESAFKDVLSTVVKNALKLTTFELDLDNGLNESTITNIPFTLFNKNLGIESNHFIHTLNKNGKPDTLVIEPGIDYRVVVHSNPPFIIESFNPKAGTHNIAKAKIPSGQLEIFMPGISSPQYYRASITKTDVQNWTSILYLNTKQQFRAGTYNINIHTLPPTNFNNVVIKDGELNKILLRQPGTLMISQAGKAVGAVMAFDEKLKMFTKVIDIDENLNTQSIHLMPGKYKLIIRPFHSKNTLLTREYDVNISSGETFRLEL